MQTGGDMSQAQSQIEAWRPLADALVDYVAVLDPQGRILLCNRRFARALQRAVEEVEGEELQALGLAPELVEGWVDLLHAVREDGRPRQMEHELGRSGRLVRTRLESLTQASRTPVIVCITRDLRRSVSDKSTLEQQALIDPLTELYNRRGFERELKRLLRDARDNRSSHALCYLDLDRFKDVNDSCGHQAGDALLRQLPTVLKPHIRRGDMLARLGGDEFGILLHGCTLDDAERIAEHLRDAVYQFRFVWQTRTFTVGVSIGIVAVTRDSDEPDNLMAAADAACYSAKDQGRNSVYVAYPHDLSIIRQRGEQRWARRLEAALQQTNGFELYCQSIQSLAAVDEAPIQHELLLRLPDRQGRPILPGAFLPAAERNELMSQVDTWVIRRSLALIGEELREPLAGHRFGINLSPLSLSDPAVLQAIQQGLRDFELAPETLYFELRETAFNLNLGAALEFMRALNEMGCGLALDGFGSGVSAFSYLKRMPVEMIKIDGALIAAMLDSPADEAIVRAINDIAHKLGIATVAEAIESETLLPVVRDLQIDYVQGFVISRPRPLSELAEEQTRIVTG